MTTTSTRFSPSLISQTTLSIVANTQSPQPRGTLQLCGSALSWIITQRLDIRQDPSRLSFPALFALVILELYERENAVVPFRRVCSIRNGTILAVA
jgi:hypothetical protein